MRRALVATILAALFIPSVATADWENDLRRACAFLKVRQNTDGALGESEISDYVFLSNTARVLLPWSHYSVISGDPNFKPNLDLAYEYLQNNRPDLEIPLYIALECCGNVLLGAPWYVEAYGDTQYETFHSELAGFITNASPNYNLPGDVFAMAQGALGLYRWAVYNNDGAFISAAESIAQTIQGLVESDTTLLSRELGEESGGMAFACVAEVAFHSQPTARKAWVETYGGYLETDLSSGLYSNCHLAWYGAAHYTAWQYGAQTSNRDAYYSITTNLLAEDAEQDGGIPNRKGGGISKDASWATNVMYLPLSEFGKDFDAEIASSSNSVQAGSQLEIDFGLANNQSATDTCFLVLFMDIPGFGPRFLGTFSFVMPGGISFSQDNVPLKISSGSPTGSWTLQVDLYNGSGDYQETENFQFTVF